MFHLKEAFYDILHIQIASITLLHFEAIIK